MRGIFRGKYLWLLAHRIFEKTNGFISQKRLAAIASLFVDDFMFVDSVLGNHQEGQ